MDENSTLTIAIGSNYVLGDEPKMFTISIPKSSAHWRYVNGLVGQFVIFSQFTSNWNIRKITNVKTKYVNLVFH